MRYGVFTGCDDYSADTRNINGSFNLWQIRRSDYSADTRKSILDKKMWPSGILGPRAGVFGAPMSRLGAFKVAVRGAKDDRQTPRALRAQAP